MGTYWLFVSVFVGVLASHAQALTDFEECVVYEKSDNKSTYYDCRNCTEENDKEYCREYSCAMLSCGNNSTQKEGDCCPYCPGTCNYFGRTYNEGDSFLCIDGSNTCSCGPNNTITTTWMASNKDTLCRRRYYGACTLYRENEAKSTNLQRLACLTATVEGQEQVVCKEYGCGYTFCGVNKEPVKNGFDDCYSCPDSCNYMGKAYSVSEIFTCSDGVNSCKCAATGSVVNVTNTVANIDSMCRSYGDLCAVYSKSDQKSSKECRYCQRDWRTPWAEYCKEYDCGVNECANPVESPYYCCSSCPGTCNEGGKVYNVGDGWTCVDGVNSCSCMATGSIITTLVGTFKESFCFSN